MIIKILHLYAMVSVFALFSGQAAAQTKSVLPVNEYEKAVQVKGVQLLDVRRPDEYREGHIKGSVNADWFNKEQFAPVTNKLDKSKTVYVYCLSGVRSDKAAAWLVKQGFTKVVNLQGGIAAWKEADKPLEK
jgi:phage shock protein E